MLIERSVDGVPIRLATERWEHVCQRHPELVGQQRKLLATLRAPAVVLQGDFGEKLAVRFYRRTPVISKYLVVAYRELGRTDGFVITAYFARRMATWRRELWKR